MKQLRPSCEFPKKTRKFPANAEEKRTKIRNTPLEGPPCYTGAMLDELEFRQVAEGALGALKQHLIAREEEEEAGFEVEEQNGVLNVLFENPPGKFVITPNTPVRQIWISALSTSFKLDWNAGANAFILPRTGEQLEPLVDRLIGENGQEKSAK
jgi:iron donor protein CyaY